MRERDSEACSVGRESQREFLKFLNRGKREEERGEIERVEKNEGSHESLTCLIELSNS